MLGTVDLNDSSTFKVHLAVIQPATFCNIDCKYCYLADRQANRKMTLQTAEQAFRFLFGKPERLNEKLVIAWHCGEPLAVPLDFYKSVLQRLQEMAGDMVKIENSVQTNATLITQEWCDFIKEWDIKIGVSIDGPQWLHDANRVDRAGRGTFKSVLRGIDLLRANNIDFSTICVLSDRSLDFPEEMWSFYKSLGVKSMAFNCEDIEGEHLSSSLNETAPARVQAFFERLLHLRSGKGPEVSIRELDYFFQGIPQWHKDFRRIENVPLCIIGIAWNGDISTFSPELMGRKDERYGDFVFGNVATATLESVLAHPQFRVVYRDIAAGVQQCRKKCGYYSICGGGSPSTKLSQNGTFDSTETLACKLRIKTIGGLAMEFLEKSCGFSSGSAQSARERVDHLLPVINSAAMRAPAASVKQKRPGQLQESSTG